VAPGVRNLHEPHGSFSASESEKSRGISAESKDTSHQKEADLKLKPARNDRKPKTQQPKEKPQNNNSNNNRQAGRRSGSGNNNNRRRDNSRRIPENNNNPNVTVRSFKSSKTRASEAAKEAKK
jgi:hypothetical protein